MKFSKKLNINLENVKKSNNNSSDINIRTIKIGFKTIGYIFLESTSSDDKISNYFMKDISTTIKFKHHNFFNDLFVDLQNQIPNSKLKIIEDRNEAFYYLAAGFTLIFVDEVDKAIVIETKAKLDRSIAEPTTEIIIRGPKDCFIENYNVNIGLIRKRIKDEKLFFDEIKVGRRTKSKVAISYIDDIVNHETVDKIKKIISNIDIDAITDSGILKEYIGPSTKTNYPLVKSSERPDIVCQALLAGKISIIVENSPFVLIFPTFFIDYFKISEDYYEKAFNTNMTRLLRFLAFFITLLTPALYIAVMTYNYEIIPDSLLISLAVQREGVPFPTGIEVILLATAFEILRESDIRMPSIMGASISIVGALVLGDAAVNAGIVSPFVVIVIAITAICGLIFSDVDFVNATRWWRALFIFGAIALGILGITTVGLIFIIHLINAEELNIPFMYPLTPKDRHEDILRPSQRKNYYRSELLTKNIIKMRNNNEN